jgi:hypothetical protein
MAESFLEEQLKRIRDMSEQMSRVRNRAAELEDELAREREGRRETIEGVRDVPHNPPSHRTTSRAAHGHARRPAAQAPRRRGR